MLCYMIGTSSIPYSCEPSANKCAEDMAAWELQGHIWIVFVFVIFSAYRACRVFKVVELFFASIIPGVEEPDEGYERERAPFEAGCHSKAGMRKVCWSEMDGFVMEVTEGK